VKVYWEAASARNYVVQVSSNLSTWQDVATVRDNTQLYNDNLDLRSTGRYIRISCLNRNTVYGYSIYELEVFGTPVNTSLAQNAAANNMNLTFASDFKVFPNPTTGPITIQDYSTYTNEKRFVRLVNKAGKVLKEEASNEGEVNFDLSGLPTDVYFIQINKNGKTKSIRLVKN
jgi:hypothetical protein